MSTKTTFKRIALVAVAALGFGVLSIVPSSAITNADTLTVSAATAAQTSSETATATSATTTLAYLAGAATDSMSVTASLVSGPAGNVALPFLQLVETSSAQAQSTIGASLAVGIGTASNTPIFVVPSAGSYAASVSAKFKVYLGSTITTAPTVAGTYVVRLTPAVTAGGGALNATSQTITITVTTAASLDTVATANSTAILNAGETNSATADAVVTGSRAINAGEAIATVAVVLKNANGTTLTTSVGESYTATLSGSGQLGSGAFSGTTSTFLATGRAITVRVGDVVGVFGDGSSGVGTVTISSRAGIVLGTKTVTFFGAATKITATLVKSVIAVGANTGVITAVATDAAGTIVSNATLKLNSGTTTVAAGAFAAATSTTAAGVATFDLTGLVAGTTSITIVDANPATITSNAVVVRAGDVAANVSIALDKASYLPGEKATISVSVVDAAGLPVADVTSQGIFASGGIVANYSLGGASAATTDTFTATTAGVKTYVVYMPSVTSTVTFTATTGAGLATVANRAVVLTVSAKVADPAVAAAAEAAAAVVAANNAAAIEASNAATDAANEATDAANAATDAALAAAEAADAATAAAQEAADAVAELSTQVEAASMESTDAANAATDAALAASEAADAATAAAQGASDAVTALSVQVATLVSGLKAQITTLSNLVLKILKQLAAKKK